MVLTRKRSEIWPADSADRTVLKCGIINNFFDQIGFSKKNSAYYFCGMNLTNLRRGFKRKKKLRSNHKNKFIMQTRNTVKVINLVIFKI